MNKIEKTAIVIGIALLIIFVAAFVLGVYFFGMAGIFRLLGIQYESIWSLFVFVISFIILGFIVEFFTMAVFNLSAQNITGKTKKFFIRIGLEGISNWLVLFTADELVHGITLSLKAEIVIGLLFALLESVFADDKDSFPEKK